MTLLDASRTVQSHAALASFLEQLCNDFRTNPETWQNANLASFLAAMAAWAQDSDGYYANRGESADAVSPWRVLTDILMAARIYE